jgi:hypothetical protein
MTTIIDGPTTFLCITNGIKGTGESILVLFVLSLRPLSCMPHVLSALSRHTSSLMPHVTCPLSCDTCQRPSSTDQQPSVCIIDGIGGTGESIFVLMSHTVSSLALCHMSSLSMPRPLLCIRVTVHDHTHSQHDGPSSMDQQPSVCIINGIKGIGEATFVLFVLFCVLSYTCHMSSLSMSRPLLHLHTPFARCEFDPHHCFT